MSNKYKNCLLEIRIECWIGHLLLWQFFCLGRYVIDLLLILWYNSNNLKYKIEERNYVNMKNKIAAVIMALIMVLPASLMTPVLAYDLPSEYWGLNDLYAQALDNNDHAATAQYGSEIVDLILKEPKNDQTSNIIGSRAYEAAFAYYFLGDYQNAVKYFNIYIPYGKEMNWIDGVKISEDFVKQLTSSLDLYLYTDTEQKYFGARNEPHGVLYGQVSEKTQPGESMVLLYLEYGDESYFDWANVVMKNAKDQGKAVEVALNFKNEGNDVRAVSASDSYLTSLYSVLSAYPEVPVYLRIGAEMNIWGIPCTPDEFKAAFVNIALKMRNMGNVATVWSVAHTSKWPSEEWPYAIEDFYPGDEYVDWVGVNAYPTKYFNGRKWDGKEQFNEICFKAGYSSDPVIMIQEVVEKFGDRKPVMVSECGSAYKTNGELNEYHSDWAIERLREMYTYIPMVYPQVKLIAYFNKNISYEYNYYDFEGAPELGAEYSSIVKSPWFIQGSAQNSAQTYFQKADDTINIDGDAVLGTYSHLFGADSLTVEYYLDQQLIHTSEQEPYQLELKDIKGTHTLRVSAKGNNGNAIERTYTIKSSKTSQSAEEFGDTSELSAVQKSALDYVIQNGIVNGYEDNTIRPYNTLTRAEFSAMICRMKGYELEEDCTFSDASSHWASKYINACVKSGAINGVGDNKFEPDSNITFEQAVKIITVVSGMADGSEQYPQGFVDVGEAEGLFENLTSKEIGSALKRIDAAMMMAQAIK